MKAICIIDTSILLEILNVPNKSSKHKQIFAELSNKLSNDETIFVSMAAIIETGNHISQNGNGNVRRKTAEKFVNFIKEIIESDIPIKPIRYLVAIDVMRMLNKFPEYAMNEITLGDVNIILDWEYMCSMVKDRRVYIWAMDTHLQGYDQPARTW